MDIRPTSFGQAPSGSQTLLKVRRPKATQSRTAVHSGEPDDSRPSTTDASTKSKHHVAAKTHVVEATPHSKESIRMTAVLDSVFRAGARMLESKALDSTGSKALRWLVRSLEYPRKALEVCFRNLVDGNATTRADFRKGMIHATENFLASGIIDPIGQQVPIRMLYGLGNGLARKASLGALSLTGLVKREEIGLSSPKLADNLLSRTILRGINVGSESALGSFALNFAEQLAIDAYNWEGMPIVKMIEKNRPTTMAA